MLVFLVLYMLNIYKKVGYVIIDVFWEYDIRLKII